MKWEKQQLVAQLHQAQAELLSAQAREATYKEEMLRLYMELTSSGNSNNWDPVKEEKISQENTTDHFKASLHALEDENINLTSKLDKLSNENQELQQKLNICQSNLESYVSNLKDLTISQLEFQLVMIYIEMQARR